MSIQIAHCYVHISSVAWKETSKRNLRANTTTLFFALSGNGSVSYTRNSCSVPKLTKPRSLASTREFANILAKCVIIQIFSKFNQSLLPLRCLVLPLRAMRSKSFLFGENSYTSTRRRKLMLTFSGSILSVSKTLRLLLPWKPDSLTQPAPAPCYERCRRGHAYRQRLSCILCSLLASTIGPNRPFQLLCCSHTPICSDEMLNIVW